MARRTCFGPVMVAFFAWVCCQFPLAAASAGEPAFRLGYSTYVGFMPFSWMRQSGILKKWADRYGIRIDLVLVNDYIGSANQFIAGDLDAIGLAGMDALTMPAAGGVDTSFVLITDYSNGNDMLISKSANSVKELSGQTVSLVQFSVSHYLLERALVMNGMKGLSEVKTANISDADIASAFLTQPSIQHAASWKPMSSDMLHARHAHILFDSSSIPGEIMDGLVVKTRLMREHPEFVKALVGAWYETMALYHAGGPTAAAMSADMASAMGTDTANFLAQIATTHFFYTASDEYAFMTAQKTRQNWDYIRTFCFNQGLFGQGAETVDSVGILLPDHVVLGDPSNIKLRLDSSVIGLARDGKL